MVLYLRTASEFIVEELSKNGKPIEDIPIGEYLWSGHISVEPLLPDINSMEDLLRLLHKIEEAFNLFKIL